MTTYEEAHVQREVDHAKRWAKKDHPRFHRGGKPDDLYDLGHAVYMLRDEPIGVGQVGALRFSFLGRLLPHELLAEDAPF